MYRIVKVKPLDNYRLWLKFSDGVTGTVDLSELVGKGVFSKWKDYNYFKSVFIDTESHTVAWPDNMDLCPDELYIELTGKNFRKILSTKSKQLASV